MGAHGFDTGAAGSGSASVVITMYDVYISRNASRIAVSAATPIPPCLQRTQIYLSQAERQGLQALALRSGRSQSALIREAIDAFLEQHQPQGRLARLRQARGLWA